MTNYPGPERRGRPAVVTAGSSEDRHSPIRTFVDAVKGMTITPFVRVISACLAAAFTFFAWDPLFHPNDPAYDRPVFDAVFTFASPLAWGIGFATCVVLLLVAAISARAAIYIAGITLSSVALIGWASMVIYQSWNSPDSLTSTAYGLYGLSFTAIVGLAFSPRQLTADKPIIAVLDDGKVVPLKQTG